MYLVASTQGIQPIWEITVIRIGPKQCRGACGSVISNLVHNGDQMVLL